MSAFYFATLEEDVVSCRSKGRRFVERDQPFDQQVRVKERVRCGGHLESGVLSVVDCWVNRSCRRRRSSEMRPRNFGRRKANRVVDLCFYRTFFDDLEGSSSIATSPIEQAARGSKYEMMRFYASQAIRKLNFDNFTCRVSTALQMVRRCVQAICANLAQRGLQRLFATVLLGEAANKAFHDSAN